MKRIGILITLFILTQNNLHTIAQESTIQTVDWNKLTTEYYNATPKIFHRVLNKESYTTFNAELKNLTVVPINNNEAKLFDLTNISNKFEIETNISIAQKISYLAIKITPIRYNSELNSYEKIVSYSTVIYGDSTTKKSTTIGNYANESALNSGNWYKIKIDTSGIYRLTYNQLTEIGLENPKNVRVYGYGGKQLSFSNKDSAYDDMLENPIYMNKGDDGIFNEGDYILFYSQGNYTWNYNEGKDLFLHSIHNYSNFIYLFLTDSFGAGKRIETEENPGNSNLSSQTTDKFKCYHQDNLNPIKSGRFWFTEIIRSNNYKTYNFSFNNRVSNEPVRLYSYTAGHKSPNTPALNLDISYNNNLLKRVITTVSAEHYVFAGDAYTDVKFTPSGNSISLKYEVTGGNNTSELYLGYICLNTRENLVFSGGQYSFRDKNSVDEQNITEFKINNSGKNLIIWDITNPVEPKLINSSKSGNNTTFKTQTNKLKEFIAFDGTLFLKPTYTGDDVGKIENQNLHATQDVNMIIVSAEEFLNEANALAKMRKNGNDPLSVLVTTPQKIYNEFSSGTPDASAIRNFMRMLYQKSSNSENQLKYLLLFGDGSYDNKTISEGNSNYIPTYQNTQAVIETTSFVSDDFYGLLDEQEGESNGSLDIGIGRFPVSTNEEAQLMLDKIKHYESTASMSNWRMNICFIADDEDGGIHLNQAEELAENVKTNNPEYNIDKVYFDAYRQVSKPSGERYPDVTDAINDAVKKGALIIDYIGHGNPRLLGHEEVLTAPDVKKWKNYDKLAVFVTASCEVGRFDNFESTSLGEWVVLSPEGGGVAALTTTRVVYSGGNHDLNINFFSNIFNKNLRLGDIIRISKNDTENNMNTRKFSLLGDPSMKLAIPCNQALVSKINNELKNTKLQRKKQLTLSNFSISTDTINALEKARIQGYLIDSDSNLVEENGILFPSIFDKAQQVTSRGNDKGSPNSIFEVQNSVLYKGQCSINNGFFDFEFILPKDINYNFGNGKISLYAVLDDSTEASGYSEDFIIGGINTESEIDYEGPNIVLYMNDTSFISGGLTNENPILLAKIQDESGINTSGAGIGHNITAVIDDNTDEIINLNDFYQGELNQFNAGNIIYPLSDLESGHHTLKLKVWDIHNNSSEAEIEFYVVGINDISISNIKNSPNPFAYETTFTFEHNQAGKDIDITIRIYDTMGQIVKTIRKSDNNGTFNIEPIIWNGTSSSGKKLANGLYVCNIEISTVDGRKTTKSSKLMIFR